LRLEQQDELSALLVLQLLPGVGDLNLQKLLDVFGSGQEALRAPHGSFARAAGPSAAASRAAPELARLVRRALDWCGDRGVQVLHRWMPDYPAALACIPNPPSVLFMWGDRTLLEREVVTVVGSRAASEYGRRVAGEVAAVAVGGGAVVASGLALGIDAEAHRAALQSGGKTLAVLGSGLARPHPRSHARLFQRIVQEGLLISEFLPHEPPFPWNFPRRNRTLAALSKVVVVVEAAQKSGALNTATHAIELGKDLLAVPGSIYAPNSRGTNTLLASASPLVSPSGILDYLSRRPDAQLTLGPVAPEGLGADALRVWDALSGASRHVDEVARAAKLGTSVVLATLAVLEVAGWVRQEPGARFSRSSSA
jgi:DNA processing protein